MTSGATKWPKSERRREPNGSERRSVENGLPVYWVFQFLPLVGADITLITLISRRGASVHHHSPISSAWPWIWRELAHSEPNIQQIVKTDDQVPHDRRRLLGSSR